MKRYTFMLFTLLTFYAVIAKDTKPIDSIIITLKQEQIKVINKGDPEGLLEVGYKMERLLTFEEKVWLINYYRSYNYYLLSNMTGDKELKEKYIDEAKKIIIKSIEQKEDFAESHSLYSSILGLEIGIRPNLGMTNGIKSSKEMKIAYDLEPNNPRTFLIDGISKLHTPAIFGGGIDKALDKLNKSEELFKKEGKRGIYPDWGKDDVYIWLGQVYEKKDDNKKALEYYRMAFEVNPDNKWAKSLIDSMD